MYPTLGLFKKIDSQKGISAEPSLEPEDLWETKYETGALDLSATGTCYKKCHILGLKTTRIGENAIFFRETFSIGKHWVSPSLSLALIQ